MIYIDEAMDVTIKYFNTTDVVSEFFVSNGPNTSEKTYTKSFRPGAKVSCFVYISMVMIIQKHLK